MLPYWDEAAAFARTHGVRVAIEPHPGFVVYNTASMLRLREAVGATVGVNFDPSHLFWQGMDPLACVRALGDAIFHVHAKDTGFQEELLALNGVLETISGDRHTERSWIFRSVGAGHPVSFWRELVGALREAGYDGALSIEHEDPLLSGARKGSPSPSRPCARRSSREPASRPQDLGQRRPRVLGHGLTVRDEHPFHRQVEQRLQRRPQPGVVDTVRQPRLRAEAQAVAVGAEDDVTRDERAVLRDPVDDLGRATARERLDAARQRLAGPEHVRDGVRPALDRGAGATRDMQAAVVAGARPRRRCARARRR